jgi:hypothetical protein
MEYWLAVPGFEGQYDASNLGRVRSLDRVVVRRGQTPTLSVRGRILAANPDIAGYPVVSLPGRTPRRVHTLVMAAFVGDCPDGLEVCHHRDIKADNRLCELRYDSHAANHADKTRNGHDHNANKTRCPAGHPYAGENLMIGRRGNGRTFRMCRTCQRENDRDRKRARRLAS